MVHDLSLQSDYFDDPISQLAPQNRSDGRALPRGTYSTDKRSGNLFSYRLYGSLDPWQIDCSDYGCCDFPEVKEIAHWGTDANDSFESIGDGKLCLEISDLDRMGTQVSFNQVWVYKDV